MLTTLPHRDLSAKAWIRETFGALGRLPGDPVVWAVTPYYTGNPYQAVLHGGFAGQGLLPAPVFEHAQLGDVTRGWPPDVPLVLHLHWLNRVLAKVTSDPAADDAVARFTELLDSVRDRGARLVWTVHNVLPHDTRFEAAEVALRQAVAERADLVHVMSPRTAELLAPRVALPAEKLYRCDHPGYHGVYPDWISRAEARRRLGIAEGSRALLLTGALKPYKGMTELLDAVRRANRGRPGALTLLVAGDPDDAPETAAFVAEAAREPAVRLLPEKMADADVQVFLRAADLVALPYRRSLNSGVLALALTFGVPVLLPAASGPAPVVATTAEGPAGILYPEGGLDDAVASVPDADLERLGRAAAIAGRRIDRAALTARYAADLRSWADTGVVPV